MTNRGSAESAQKSTARWSESKSLDFIVVAGLLLVGGWLIFGQLGDAAFHDGDEALYATIAMEMAESGDWLTPHYWGEPFLHKPPLQYWLSGLAFKFVPGTAELKARFPSAVAGLVLLCVVYFITRRLAGTVAGAGAVLILLFNHQFLFEHTARSANFDSMLMLLCFTGLVGGAYAHVGRLPKIVSAVSIAGVMLLKTPVAVFPLGSVFGYLLITNRKYLLLWLGWLGVSVVVIVLPWTLHQAITHGRVFWDTFFVYEILGRTGAAITAYQSRFLHLEAFWRSFLPWSPLLVIAAFGSLAGWPSAGEAAVQKRNVLKLMTGYAGLILVVLCFVPSKWPWYGLPAYSALVVVGAVWARDLLHTRWRVLLPPLLSVLVAVRVLLFDASSMYAPAARRSFHWPTESKLLWFTEDLPGSGEWIVAIAAIIAGIVLPVLWRSRRVVTATALVMAVLIYGVSLRTIAAVPRDYDGVTKQFVDELERRQLDRAYLIGFPQKPWYNNRMEPLTSFYFLSLRDVEFVDCGWDIECVRADHTGRVALIIHANAASQSEELRRLINRLAPIRDRSEIWTLDPRPGGSYRRLG
ncbi:MAG: glycosyltransferase family 39 protein [Candidatus Latescibacterota bacterium]|nr:MAG: glycosyltransferase family 39 protein [Candidatus Latescibacterota bacterium]